MFFDITFEHNKQLMNSEYKVLARKYRPRSFDEVIGQDVFIRVIKNAFIQNRIAHAFLLHGTRGVGKTTTARIIALALNCENGPTPNPCGQCSNCTSIIKGQHQDVIEIDAASNNGVGDIRELTDSIKYNPFFAKYKVYIIDEVHMLSVSAFNAFLKTLEEPPAHTKFIFATTEINKIPNTIISRCQKFDLKRIELEKLISYYQEIVHKEGFEAEDQALKLIAIAASGSVRDGLSILDQALNSTTTNKKLETKQVEKMLGVADWTTIYKIAENMANKDTIQTIELIDQAYNQGADLMLLLENLMELIFAITTFKLTGKNSLYNEDKIKMISALSTKFEISSLSRVWMILSNGYQEMKYSPLPKYCLEMLLVRAIYTHSLPSLEELLASQ